MTSITSERLLLRTLNSEDVTERYVGWLNDPQVNRFLETRFVTHTLESCRKFVSQMEQDPCSYLFGIFDKETLEHLGNVKLGFINPHHKKGQLSLLIGEKSIWGKGYATEAVRTITQWGFDELGLERIEAGCYETHLASKHIFLKIGYTVDGYFRSSVAFEGRRIGAFMLSILRNEPIK